MDKPVDTKRIAASRNLMRSMFTRIAGMYDRLNRIMSLGTDVLWRKRALKRLSVSPKLILDIAAGTADFSIMAAKRYPKAMLTGLDLTPAMLEIGNIKAEKAGVAQRVKLVEGDALQLPFEAESFDAAISAFGFRNFPDQFRALSEAYRVLREGGELLVVELFRPKFKVMGKFTNGWINFISPFFCKGSEKDYAYLRSSIDHTVSVEEFAETARKVGFELCSCDFFLPACSCLLFRK